MTKILIQFLPEHLGTACSAYNTYEDSLHTNRTYHHALSIFPCMRKVSEDQGNSL